jgi:hypothetical protein
MWYMNDLVLKLVLLKHQLHDSFGSCIFVVVLSFSWQVGFNSNQTGHLVPVIKPSLLSFPKDSCSVGSCNLPP